MPWTHPTVVPDTDKLAMEFTEAGPHAEPGAKMVAYQAPNGEVVLSTLTSEGQTAFHLGTDDFAALAAFMGYVPGPKDPKLQ